MILFPAIDLKDGACVRLAQGDFDAATHYAFDPVAQAKTFEDAGATWLHVVDLDGAKAGCVQQLSLITAITQQTALKVQVGGGIRRKEDITALLATGAARVIIGSLAIKQPALVRAWLDKFGGDKIVLAFDVLLNTTGLPEVVTEGWQEGSAHSLWNALDTYRGSDLKTILCTDVSRDGMMTGANRSLYAKIQQKRSDLFVLASGGVNTLDDVMALEAQRLGGAIIGKALYEGAIDLKAAIAATKEA
ncbi:MAG: 1-(5-phosphoribosyl)-5-[(5-phosphoribosylamino)methylideneamino]imidazole-4-carboxamide isomerase [Bdellovibrionales bacterium]|jgi:phosphoribosylformimino-5-aminoimidazole carboxamide ribotide isomerase